MRAMPTKGAPDSIVGKSDGIFVFCSLYILACNWPFSQVDMAEEWCKIMILWRLIGKSCFAIRAVWRLADLQSTTSGHSRAGLFARDKCLFRPDSRHLSKSGLCFRPRQETALQPPD